MGIYQNICYKVEDLLVKAIAKKLDPAEVKAKVNNYRIEKERARIQRKEARVPRTTNNA
ncbi:hypothetical protein [Cytobacillus firmus]|uniref:hypothetical protein n=1 Tax=Cytobacillus firmus TaxID=1399 RepID=UPI002163281A|nr:hypothetical protein [Cytobacillus firmus]MCS0670432.1 hypothetical protein [Cytobacillus firmus]